MANTIGSGVGTAVSSGANILNNYLAYRWQKKLNRQRYQDMLDYASQYGATPTAKIQGITGSAGGSMPTVSTSNNPVGDLGQSYLGAVQATAAQRQAGAAESASDAALTNAETERQIALMRLKFEPGKYLADIRKALSDVYANNASAFSSLHQGRYFAELANDLVQVRPWKIASMRQGLLNDIATYDKILQDIKTGKAQEQMYKSSANELDTRSDVNKGSAKFLYYQTKNEALRGVQLQFENDLRKYGIDPNKGFWENTFRLMYTDPKTFKQRTDCFVEALNIIDGRLQDNLGEHYKRTAILGYGLYKLNDIHQKNANARSYRFKNGIDVISSLIGAGIGSPRYSAPYPY